MLLVEGNDAKIHGYRNGFISPAASNGYAKELGCDERRTKEERVDFRTHVVDGCGQRVTYVQVCNPHCSWLANSAMAAALAKLEADRRRLGAAPTARGGRRRDPTDVRWS
jgi:hypothetical protein